MSALVLGGALALDWLVGEPPNRVHPTAWMGALAERLARVLPRTLGGGLLLLGGVTLSFSTGAYLVAVLLPVPAKLLFSAVVLKLALSWRSLGSTALGIARMVEEGRLEDARGALPALVGRRTSSLSREEVCSACIESVAENSVDSVASPVFYFTLLSAAGGLELGLAGAVAYRCVNTLDAMVGYPELGSFGKPSALADDVLNFVPARLMVPCMIVASLLMRLGAALRGSEGVRVADTVNWMKYRSMLRSPNAGLSISMVAGALGVWLHKPGFYRIPGERAPEPEDVRRAVSLVNLSLGVFAGAAVWAMV